MNIWVFLRLAIISSKVAADTVYEFLCGYVSFGGYISRSEVARSCGNSTFVFLRN